MGQINPVFYLKSSMSKESLIMMRAYFYKQRLVYSTGLKINPIYWDDRFNGPITDTPNILRIQAKEDPSKELERTEIINEIKAAREKNPRFNEEMSFISSELSRFKAELGRKFEYLRTQELIITTELIKIELNKIFKPEISSDKKCDFFQVFNEFIEIRRKQHANTTIKKHLTLKNELVKFQEREKYKISFESIDLKFYERFKNYLLRKNLNSDTVSKYFKSVKTFMQWALERGYHLNTTFKHPSFSASSNQKIPNIILSHDEFNRIRQLDLSLDSRLEKVQDIFVFSTLTGQRIKDVLNIKRSDLEGSTWNIIQHKTKEYIRIPLDLIPGSTEILKKYNYNFPVISEQKYNDYLKEIGKLAKIEEMVTLKRFSGKKDIGRTRPKYEFMSSHLARRTCITWMLEGGVPPTTIMQLTGHRDIKTLMKYNHTGEDALKVALKGFYNKVL